MTRPFHDRLAGSARASLFVTVLFVLAGCGGKGAGPGGKGGFAMPPAPVEVAEVRATAVRDLFRALGSLDALQEADIVAEVSGRVLALPFPEGRSVDSGAVLARLDDRELRAQRDRASAALALARSEAKRVEDLYARDVVSPRERDESRASLAAAEAELALQQTRFDRTTVRAPFTGVTGRRLVSAGAVVRVNDPVVHLARLDRLRVQFAVPERYAGVLRAGAKATVQVTAWPGQDFPAWVTVVEPSIDPKTRTFTAVAEVRNLRERLRPGMSASVSVSLAERVRALTVPDEAVLAEGDQAFVYKVGADSTVARVPVTLGTRDAARVEIVNGLAEGDHVVSAGHQKLYPGAKVMPVVSAAPADSLKSSTANAAGH
ncbi:MAG: efflux RND transporter periplasmic adaptor subunit [Candidatus Eisenbacteria bacterium]|nr:efflux RND transporter periplasmic adaptor subunit [Candidatus Eisenbacteria bacterium]